MKLVQLVYTEGSLRVEGGGTEETATVTLYQDLIQWILKPSTPLTVSSTWELTFFDLKSHLEPLFWVWLPGLGYLDRWRSR